MSIEQVVDPWEQWLPRDQPADLREFDELVEEAEFEAEVRRRCWGVPVGWRRAGTS